MSFLNRAALHAAPNVSIINLLLACVLSGLCSAGCASKDGAQDSQSLPSELQALAEKYADVIDQLPYHAQAEDVLLQFLQAAQPQAKVAGLTPEVYLMYQFPSNNLGLYCLDRFLKSNEMAAPEGALAFCAEVQQKAPATPLARAALARELSLLSTTDDAAFRSTCNRIISTMEKTPELKIALFTRAQYFAEHNQPKAAALDLLKLWAWYGDQIKAMDAEDSTLAAISNAGFAFESSVLSASRHPARIAQFFLDEFGAASIIEFDEACANAPGAVGAYLRWSPDVEKIKSAAPSSNSSEPLNNREKALQSLRQASLYAIRSDLPNVLENYQAALSSLTPLAGETTHDATAYFGMKDCCWFALETLRKLDANLSTKDRGAQEFKNKSPKIALSLADCYLELARQSTDGQEEEQNAVTFREAVDNYVLVALRFNDRKRAPQAYRLFVETFPRSSSSPEVLIALGDLLKSTYNLPSQACDAYREAADNYPDSPQKPMAKWKLAVALYEMDKYPESYETCLSIMAEFPGTSQADSASLTSAFCESAMGQPDLAEQHLEEFCRTKPQSPVAPKALLLLATQTLSMQNYEKASAYLQDLTERYPETTEALTAKEYLEILKNMEKTASGN